MKSPILNRVRDGRMAFSPEAIHIMSGFRQDTLDKLEAGGVMLGRHIINCSDVVVDEVTVPMPGDVRGRTFFYRAQVNHQRVIDEVWHRSQGTCTYLGEWHTHPEDVPNPSWVDLRDWHRKLKEDVFEGDTLVFVIIGIRLTRVWEGQKGCKQFRMIGQFATQV